MSNLMAQIKYVAPIVARKAAIVCGIALTTVIVMKVLAAVKNTDNDGPTVELDTEV
jgi:hypothetical protein